MHALRIIDGAVIKCENNGDEKEGHG